MCRSHSICGTTTSPIFPKYFTGCMFRKAIYMGVSVHVYMYNMGGGGQSLYYYFIKRKIIFYINLSLKVLTKICQAVHAKPF